MQRWTALVMLAAAALLVAPAGTAAQGLTSRPPRPEDVASIDGIIAAFYDVVSHAAGQPIDWARDSTLYLAELRFKIAGPRGVQLLDHAAYAAANADVSEGFFEREIQRVTHRFGPIAHVFSTYEWRRTPDGPVGGRGINSIELAHDGTRWWISSAMWTSETAEDPIPGAYLPRAESPVGAAAAVSADSVRTRSMNDINWMEFAELVPARIRTVIVTVGTLEPHGVVNNGADNTAPIAIAREIAGAPGIDALIAPHIPYGVTGSMAPYPGALSIPDDAFRAYFRAVLEGMVKNRFRDIIVINGHGGGQTAILQDVAREVALERGVNTLVVNWWTLASDITLRVFGEDGGHAGINETAFVQAIDPTLVQRARYTGPDMATANPAPGAWSAVPFPSSISLYRPGEGWPRDFDAAQAEQYYREVVARVGDLVADTLAKWRRAGF